MATLTISNLRFHHLGPFSFQIPAGECLAISGPSGAGKTLMLRAIADLDPHGGNVTLDDCDCQSISAPQWRTRVALLPAESSWWYDSVGEHFTAVNEEYFSFLGFNSSVVSWPITRLSSGERQRLALLRLLTNNPDALLLDEPTANLDGENTRLVEKLLSLYQQQTGASIFWVAHDHRQISRITTMHYRLEAGELTRVKGER
ncbi:MAG: ATP-binding cassette domain-containing protein [Deltaproteobacteria bacterium]|nr:ATP-binding cassette domain-containing protein [Candidatus Anaeroferrophillus wilburensis]MBN2887960.1 ATP-binding cassette domain-containing protein [Deltaproteobacteria bacterium]